MIVNTPSKPAVFLKTDLLASIVVVWFKKSDSQQAYVTIFTYKRDTLALVALNNWFKLYVFN